MPKGHYERRKHTEKWAITYKDNFWSKKRVEKNIRVKDLAEMLELKPSTLNTYFTGQSVPNEATRKALCDLFGVDLIEGTREFYKAYKVYKGEHNRTLVLSAKTEKKIAEATKPEPSWEDEPTPIEKVAQEIKERQDKIFEVVYGKVTYKQYCNLMEEMILNEEGKFDIKAWLYGKVDFETFSLILKKLEE